MADFRFSCLARHVSVYVRGATAELRVKIDVIGAMGKPYKKVVQSTATLTMFMPKEAALQSLSAPPLRSPRRSVGGGGGVAAQFPIHGDDRDDAMCRTLCVLYANPNCQEVSSSQPSMLTLSFGLDYGLVSMVEELRLSGNVWLDIKLQSMVVHEQEGSRELFLMNSQSQTLQVELEDYTFQKMMQRVQRPQRETLFNHTAHDRDALDPELLKEETSPTSAPPLSVSDGPLLLASGNYNECVLMCYNSLKAMLAAKVKDRQTGKMYVEVAKKLDRGCVSPKSELFLANVQALIHCAQLADRGLKGFNAFSAEEAKAVYDQTVALMRLFGDGILHIE